MKNIFGLYFLLVALFTIFCFSSDSYGGSKIKFVTEYIYPVEYELTQPQPQFINGKWVIQNLVPIPFPTRFATREVGVQMHVSAEVSSITPNMSNLFAEKEQENFNGINKLMIYASSGNLDKVKEIIYNKTIDINSKSKLGSTALMGASSGGHLDVVKFLINSGADRDIKNRYGKSALDFARNNNHKDVEDFLNKKEKKYEKES